MALGTIPLEHAHALIHHSDRGYQYCSYEYTQETQYRHQHDAERGPAGERHRRTRQRHPEDGMAVQEEVRHTGRMPSGTREDNPVLQRRTTAHEHRDAYSRRSARAGRTAKEVLEDAPRTTGGKEKDIWRKERRSAVTTKTVELSTRSGISPKKCQPFSVMVKYPILMIINRILSVLILEKDLNL